MTTESDVLAAIAEKEVSLYHGTRRSLATAIMRDGFQPTPVAELTTAVARAYGVAPEAVHAHLTAKARFSISDPDRARTVSTTADEHRAGRWAGRAPEAVWDALRAVFVLTHPDFGDPDAMSEAADFWVMAQRVDDPPVVVELTSRLGVLHNGDGSTGRSAMQTIRRKLDTYSTTHTPEHAAVETVEAVADFFGFLFGVTPEWRIPTAEAKPVSVSEPVAFRVSQAQLAYLSEQSVVELGPPHVRNRVWGPPRNNGEPGSDWWPFDQVWPLLTPRRRAQLEDFAGRSID